MAFEDRDAQPAAARSTRRPSLAEIVADDLRRQILDGTLEDGDALSKQDTLVSRYGVSPPSIREAMRILETEGLITVRLGKRGGAIIHRPKAQRAAYMLAMVLESLGTPLSDVAVAIQAIEPECAALCARRDDRAEAVLPYLREIHAAAAAAIADGIEYVRLARRFHEELATRCGSATMHLVVGALEGLWSGQEEAWAVDAAAEGQLPDEETRRRSLAEHGALIDAIDEGDAGAAARIARTHLIDAQRYSQEGGHGEGRIVSRTLKTDSL